MRTRLVFALALSLSLLAVEGAATAETVRITVDDCAALTAHEPADDVAYQPGVDVNGKPVAPADLDAAGQLELPSDHEYWLEIALPLRDAVRASDGSALDRVGGSEIVVGVVTVRDGDAYFDGEPLGSQETHAVLEACAAMQDPPLVRDVSE